MSGQSLRVLQVLRVPIGGLYRHVADLSAELAARGHSVGLVMDSGLEDAQTAARLTPLLPNLALGVHRMPMARLLGLSDITTPLALRRLIKLYDVDVVHGHGAKGGFHARLARWGMRKPVAIYTPHGGALHFSPHAPAGLIFDRVERGLFGLTDGVAFESAYAQQLYFKRIGTPTCPTPVIHNGLAAAEFETLDEAPDAADFAFVGELRDLKGIMYLLEALAPLTAPNGRQPTLVIAGDGALRQQIEARIQQPDLAGRVRLLGVQPARQVFALGQCVVVPSLAESLPYVVLEAAAAGKPVIATRVGGIPEIFGNSAKSLVPAADSDALRDAMRAFLNDSAQALKHTQTRRTYVEAHFSLGGMADQIEGLYRTVLNP